jgi:hypothetical protein
MYELCYDKMQVVCLLYYATLAVATWNWLHNTTCELRYPTSQATDGNQSDPFLDHVPKPFVSAESNCHTLSRSYNALLS